MKQKFLLFISAFVLTLFGTQRASAAPQQDAKGYFLIATAEDLVWWGGYVNDHMTDPSMKGKLVADIDMTGINLMPIGMYASNSGTQIKFMGHFDGQGHIIKNLTVDRSDYYEAGLFSRCESATLENFGIVNATIRQRRAIRAGVVAGEIYISTVRNVFVTGDITVESYMEEGGEFNTEPEQYLYWTGGFAGETNGSNIRSCYTTAPTFVDARSNSKAGIDCWCGEEEEINSGDFGTYTIPALTSEMLTSGELACRLNTDPNNIRWYQTLGEDAYPIQDATHKRVYAHGNIKCNGVPEDGATCTYSNEESQAPDHSWGDDGFCGVCGIDKGYCVPAADDWYEITTGDELRYVSRVVNAGNNGIGIRLMNDIDLSEISNFPPIGYYNDNGATTGFHGVFDGQNHIISNLTVYVDDGQEAGLFGRINNGGTLRNLGVVNADITNGTAFRAGIVAGEIHAVTINNVFTAGTLNVTTEHSQKGGISGEAASATFNNCYSTYDGPIANAPGALNNGYGNAFEDALTGELAWNLNGKTFRNPIYYQKIGEDDFPVLDSSHGVVYKADEEEYKTAITPEEFKEITDLILAQEKAGLEGKVASANLLAAYAAELNKLEGLSYDEFLAGYDALGALREAVANSEAAYKAYTDKVAEVKEYLSTHDDFSGEERDILEAYLTETFEPGENEAYPNGSYPYIIEERLLNNNLIKQEAAYVQQMLETAIANGYAAGSDITKKLVNADFADNLNGWTTKGTFENSGSYGSTHARLLRDGTPNDANQTLNNVKPGLYEFQVNCYTELGSWTQVATYNYGGGFVYANGMVNYLKPQGAELMSEEIYETLTDAEKGNLRAVMSEEETNVVLGYKPGNLTGVAIMMDRGVWNNRILAVVGEDGDLTVGLSFEKVPGRTSDMFFANARLKYLGEIDSEYSTEALDAVLADMVTAANHIVYDYVADYYAQNATDAPNFTKSMAEELKAAIASAATAGTNAEKYALTQTFGDIFQRIWESKKLYTELAQLNESVMKTCEDALSNDPAAFNKFVSETYEPIMDMFEKGEATNAEVEAKIEELKDNEVYKLQQGEEPELVDGFYQITNAYNLIWFSNQSNNNGKNGSSSLNAVLVNDIDMTPIGNFTPIALHRDNVDWDGDGTNDGVGIGTVYSGTFDGQGHVIKNLNIIHYDGCEAGFFSRCQGATVRNLGFENAHIENLRTYADGTAGIRAGILAGEFYVGLLENCWATGNIVIETIHSQKGLCGESAQSTLRGCWTTYETLASGGSHLNSFAGLDVEEMHKSGALCFLLNGDQSVISWYQTMGEDEYPTLDASHKQVYAHGGFFCDASPKPETTFDNVESEYVVDAHEFDEMGICNVCGYDSGTLTPVNGWYEIATAYNLRWFAKYVNAGNTGANARLVADIDLENKLFFPIGIYSDAGSYQGYGNCAYNATFDGQGHIIYNLNVEGTGNVELGLFSRCSTSAHILNLGIVNARVVNNGGATGRRLGALAGEANGTEIRNVFSAGTIVLETEHPQKNGLVGEASSGHFHHCYTTYPTMANLGSFENCWVGGESTNAEIHTIPAGALESGELCYSINQGEFTTPTWFQTLGEDKYPVLDNTHKIVYRNDDGTYTNERKGLAAYDGTEENPFRIETVNQFCQLIDYMHPGQLNYVVLENDLDMDGVETWIPINCDAAVAGYQNFIHFDGQNHVIKNFHPTNTEQNYQSIFGIMSGTVKNLGVENADVTCTTSGTGILCAWIGRTASYGEASYVDHCWVTGKLNASGYAGALSGHTEGEAYIRNCYVNADITSTSSVTGGIIGRVRGKLQMDNVYAAGSHNHGGGIIGGGQQAATPACTYNNIVVWNNYFENFGETTVKDKMTNVSYYNNTNFAELQQAVVAWDSSIWSCGMADGEYPVLIGTGATSLAMPKLNIAKDAIYTLTGVKVAGDLNKLPKGIYIINGKKTLIK
ncbi:MAG: hypothetical protein IJR87_00580 [Bacteroidaceae bacterium]|nr:hypothetical protein [Bacteroidaceae bacterium]